MEYIPTYELYLTAEDEGQFDEIKDIIQEHDQKNAGRIEDPVFTKIHLCRQLIDRPCKNNTITGCWKYSDIYSQAINILGADNVKISLDNVPYEQAFAEETKNRTQFNGMRKNQTYKALKVGMHIEWNSDLYRVLRMNHSREQARDLIFEGKLDQISADLQYIGRVLDRMTRNMSKTSISELQEDLLEEQKEQM